MWTFLCDGLESREFLSHYVRTIIARAIFESRPHRKRHPKGCLFAYNGLIFLRDANFLLKNLCNSKKCCIFAPVLLTI